MFRQACEIVKEAIDADNAKDYRRAFNQYQKALTYFVHVVKCKERRRRPDGALVKRQRNAPLCAVEANPQVKATIQVKIGEYFDRAEELKKMLDGTSGGAGGASGGTAAMQGEAGMLPGNFLCRSLTNLPPHTRTTHR